MQFDGFCKLYVALTRAKRATYVILPYREEKGEMTADSMWKVVRSAARSCEKGTEDTLPDSVDSPYHPPWPQALG